MAIAITEADPGLRGLSEVKFFMPLPSAYTSTSSTDLRSCSPSVKKTGFLEPVGFQCVLGVTKLSFSSLGFIILIVTKAPTVANKNVEASIK